MEKYSEYKDSGVQWLGEIPSHWEVCKNKFIFKESEEKNTEKKYQLLSFSKSKGIIPYSEINDKDSSSEDLSKYKVLHAGQLLENRLQAWNGMFSHSEIEGCVSPDYSVFDLIKKDVHIKFVSYLFRTPLYIEQWANASKGIGSGFNRLYTPQFNSIPCLLPPLCEQITMVAYLDTVTAKIDEAIAQQQKMIDLLNERKQIIINNAVTKGLNPDVKMKDSGVDWIGEIPEGWEVLALKYILKLRRKLVGTNSYKYALLSLTLKGIIKRNMDNPEGKWPKSFDSYQEVNPGDFVFCNFDNEETPRAVGLSAYRGMITGAYDVMTCINTKISKEYLILYLLFIDNGKKFKPLYKGLRKTVPIDSLMSYKIPIPPFAEQKQIAESLLNQLTKINEAVELSAHQISLLQERKQIIINDVVTGKVKVS